MKIIVVVNEGGGSVAETPDALHEAFAAIGVDADIRMTKPEALRNAFEAAAKEAPDAIVAGGGDGTISLGAAVAVEHGLVLGVLPLGTLNHLARDAGIPGGLKGALDVIAAGDARSIDVAEVNGHIFVNNSSVGLYTMMVRERDAQQKRLGRSKRLAMLVASVRALRHFGRRRLTIKVEGREQPIVTPLLFVGNNVYDISLFALGRRTAIDGGELCIYALHARNRRQLIGLALRGLFGRLDQQRDFIRLAGVRDAEIASRKPALAVSADGETLLLDTPLRYRIHPGALRLLMPASEAAP